MAEDDHIGFPAFLPASHSLYKFSDAVFHTDCYMSWDKREKFDGLYQKYRDVWNSRPKNLKTLVEIETWGKQAFRDLFNEDENN